MKVNCPNEENICQRGEVGCWIRAMPTWKLWRLRVLSSRVELLIGAKLKPSHYDPPLKVGWTAQVLVG
jgi:hypothetical protein